MKFGRMAAATLMVLVVGCAEGPKKEDKVLQGQATQQIGTLEGALISEDIQTGPLSKGPQPETAATKTVIVQCPSCHQRVDVTGLPRESIRCPNCNSLFTY